MMKNHGRSSGSEPSRAAAEWFAMMRGPVSDADRAAFEAWRAVPENARAFAHVEQTWEQSIFLASTPIARRRDLNLARTRTVARRAIATGLSALLIGAAGWSLLDHGRLSSTAVPAQVAELKADRSALRIVRLPDGSHVTLDREATVRIAFSKGERRLRLVRGRARFDVAHDPGRPFIVDAGNGSIVAHGTVFDVALEGPDARVILVRGLVEVRHRDDRSSAMSRSRMLAPGQQLVIGKVELAQPSPAGADALAWTNDMIVFNAAPLSDAIAAMNRTGAMTIRLEARSHAQQQLSGAFRRGDPDGFAQGVAVSFGLVVRRGSDGAIILDDPSAGGF